jgi:hypothetical protein
MNVVVWRIAHDPAFHSIPHNPKLRYGEAVMFLARSFPFLEV